MPSILLSGYLLEFIWRLLLLLQHQQPKIYGEQVAGHRVDRGAPQWMDAMNKQSRPTVPAPVAVPKAIYLPVVSVY